MHTTSASDSGSTRRDSAPTSAEVLDALDILEIPLNIDMPPAVAAIAVRCARIVRVREDSIERAWSLEEEELPKARIGDQAAFAAAIERDEADPGPTRTMAVQEELADAVRRSDAALDAEMHVRDELLAAIGDASPAWRSRLAGNLAKTQTAYTKTIANVRDAHAQLIAASVALGWLDNPTRPASPLPLMWIDGLDDQYGRPMMVAELLRILGGLADPR